jgi:hypothetical protein
VEGRGWVTRVGIDLVNWQQEEPADFDGRRQLSKGGTSRMSREAQVRICERLGAKFPGPTRQQPTEALERPNSVQYPYLRDQRSVRHRTDNLRAEILELLHCSISHFAFPFVGAFFCE